MHVWEYHTQQNQCNIFPETEYLFNFKSARNRNEYQRIRLTFCIKTERKQYETIVKYAISNVNVSTLRMQNAWYEYVVRDISTFLVQKHIEHMLVWVCRANKFGVYIKYMGPASGDMRCSHSMKPHSWTIDKTIIEKWQKAAYDKSDLKYTPLRQCFPANNVNPQWKTWAARCNYVESQAHPSLNAMTTTKHGVTTNAAAYYCSREPVLLLFIFLQPFIAKKNIAPLPGLCVSCRDPPLQAPWT